MGGFGNDTTIDVEKLLQLPQEMQDEILLYIGSFDLAIRLQRYWVAGKLYNVTINVPENVLMKITKFLSLKNKNDLLVYSATHGYKNVMKNLLLDPRVDPPYLDNSAIRMASLHIQLW